MKKFILIFCLMYSAILNTSNAAPRISFEDLLVQGELNPQIVLSSKEKAITQGKPVSIMTTDGIMIDVKFVENDRPVYAVFTNFADIYDGGYAAYYEDVVSKINFANARIDYGNRNIVDNTNGYFTPKLSGRNAASSFIMVTESTSDRVSIFNAFNGDLIDTAFIPSTRPQLTTPKHALKHFSSSNVLICDQVSDVVQEFNLNGTYKGYYAPASGPNNSIVDNMRGMQYKANNNLLVTVGSGVNQNTVQEFDPTGNHIGAFTATNLTSPFDILIRPSDVLVSNFSTTNRISRFDNSGVFLNYFYTGSNFGITQQLYQVPANGNVCASAFQSPSGLAILDSSGVFIKLLTGITGNRGVQQLGNGNFLVTNSAGAHEIDSASGSLVRTILASPNFQYASKYEIANPYLRLKINLEACAISDTLNVELRNSSSPYNVLETQTVVGGLGAPTDVQFSTPVNGTPYYIRVTHRNSVSTWSGSTPSFNSNYINYTFISASSQAYGNNMVNTGGKWSFYGGDANQDGSIDVTDISLIDNDSFNFASGYLVTDIDCNDVIDLSDIAFTDNNALNFVGEVTP
ncbi:MAG: hypothetical protein IPM96_09795 [Ignavibacteria bacterium]|nr:hypothetical protein [Ignavibacteria bacterium]